MIKEIKVELDEVNLAKMLKEHCERTWCSDCMFTKKGSCEISGLPIDWEV